VCVSVAISAAESPVADAAARGDREAVKSLLKQAADVNAAQGDGMTALHWAAMNGDARARADADLRRRERARDDAARHYTPLYLASQQGHGQS
jgi:ankyrin repeat protein